MPKFYVRVGSYRIIISARDSDNAVQKAVVKASLKLGDCPRHRTTTASEVGFDMDAEEANPHHRNDETFMTEIVYDKVMNDCSKKKKKKT